MPVTTTPLRYQTKRCSSLTDEELAKFSNLFSEHYGVWSGKDKPEKKGNPIRMTQKTYEKLRSQPDMFVSYCTKGNEVIGQAFFLCKVMPDGRKIAWVTQLVVHHFYRNRSIGKKLLRSAWGFSNYIGWGLATTNAITIKTLEAVTWRKVDPMVILNHLDDIRQLCDIVGFANKDKIKIAKKHSQVFTDFYPLFEKIDKKVEDIYVERLGKIENGCEWLAFTFQEQPFSDTHRMNEMLDFSAEQLEDAYSRMEMRSQPWAKHTIPEVNFIEKHLDLKKSDRILDLGCGQGRHTVELARKGYNVTGVDFSERLICHAQNLAHAEKVKADFQIRDARNLTLRGNFDKIICVYDVIGSFRTYADNQAIAASIFKKLSHRGKAIVSVMNMELTAELAVKKADISANPKELLELPPCNIMQKTGDVFDPKYFVLDEKSHLVYRKEQFEFDGELSAEYVIADYRFTAQELKDMFIGQGFNVLECRYVRAGHWDEPLSPTDKGAKEILMIIEKP